ncbi:enediyne biosynthesis protein [Saccharothrix obliqua]|uniref:enediyne biosynthesis protein n=1 Tax=Saccharothrix obliqua TaxID=2861747 RepID=UPI0027E365BA|nr:enediyne biosynthesis protein [Saccharothrix obliqua]
MAKENARVSPRHDAKVVIALRRFAISISIFNIFGYTVLGFEQPWLWPFIALFTAYTTEFVLEFVAAKAEGRAPRYAGGGVKGVLEFLYPAHITGLALNMLTYVNDQVLVMVFGVVVAVSAKWVLRAPVRGRLRHYMNPSNLGIAVILLLFPWASIAPPYHFTEHVDTWVGWIIVVVILVSGTMLNAKLTGRVWLVGAWLVVFALQAVVRGLVFGTSIPAALGMMTGVAFVLFTNYMVSDPGTTPSRPSAQIAFGGGVALAYGLLTAVHIAYGLFLATAGVCLIRGMFLWGVHFVDKARAERAALEAAAREAEVTADPIAVPTGNGHAPATEPVAASPVVAEPVADHRVAR